MLLVSLICCTPSSTRNSQYQSIPHNELSGKTDYIHFTSIDTGYLITHIGNLYDSLHCTYVYQTVDGGVYWEIVDSIPNFSFRKYSHAIHKEIVYGYVNNGTLDEYWNSYLCLIDLKRHQHRVRDEAISGPGDVFILKDSIHFPIYKDNIRYILRLDEGLNDIFYEYNNLPRSIKNISYNDSMLALITYRNKKVYYFQSNQINEFQIDIPCDGILILGTDCYLSYRGNKEHDGGMIRHNCLSNCLETLDFPRGYKIVEILKSECDSVIITCAREDVSTFPKDVVYSIDKGKTWKKIPLSDPIIFFECNSSYCAPYLFIKSSFSNEIYKLRVE